MNKFNMIQEDILKKFMYKKKLKYNEIWDKKICSYSHFNYYFKKLVNENYLKKEEEYYILDSKGINLISNLDGKTIKSKKKPVNCSFFLPIKNDKILLYIRNKQPFLGYIGLAGGKIENGNSSLEQAKIELKEETGLTGDFKLKLIGEYITKEITNNQISHHIIGFHYIVENIKDDLKPDIREGEYIWLEPKELKKYSKQFPDAKQSIDIILKNIDNNHISHHINHRKTKNNEFI